MHDQPISDEELTVQLTYFKRSGKFYDKSEFQAYANWPLYEIWNLVRKLREEGRLPGLVDGAGREFMILINVPGHRHEHPHLIV
jgi:hypothetical protein